MHLALTIRRLDSWPNSDIGQREKMERTRKKPERTDISVSLLRANEEDKTKRRVVAIYPREDNSVREL